MRRQQSPEVHRKETCINLQQSLLQHTLPDAESALESEADCALVSHVHEPTCCRYLVFVTRNKHEHSCPCTKTPLQTLACATERFKVETEARLVKRIAENINVVRLQRHEECGHLYLEPE